MNILITAGPTIERIDPVRFISNRSSGKMGYALANSANRSGHNVTLISGSCWQKATAFQLKLGHDPEAAHVPLVNLRTRKVDVLIFDEGAADE